MSDRSRKQQRHRLKREQKRRERRRAASVSPYRRAATGELIGCWVNHDWADRGQATVWVLRQHAGRLAFAAFFIDTWCAGLKDAWGRLDIQRDEFDDVRERMSAQLDETIAPCELALARGLVAAGIRFAVQNGFRLASRYDRWTAFLGDGPLGWKEAPLDGFGVEGDPTRLRWIAPLQDLQTRLIACTVEQFLQRPDVEVILDGVGTNFEEIEPEEDDDLSEEDLSQFQELSEHTADAARRWCIDQGLTPEPMLVEAMAFTFAALTMSAPDPAHPPTSEDFRRARDEILQEASLESRQPLIAACKQAEQFVLSFDSPAALLRSLQDE